MRFTKEQTDFLSKEFNINFTPEKEISLNREEQLQIREKCFQIEIEETLEADDNPLSLRGEIAVSLVDLLKLNNIDQ